MNEFNWGFTYNPFETATRSSAKKMSILAPDHLSKIRAELSDPDIGALEPDTAADVLNFNSTYAHWVACKGTYQGETNRFTNLIAELSNLKIKQWDAQIQVVFLEGTSDYIALLPSGRKPFQSGAYDIRLAEVNALAERLTPYATLVALKTLVETHYNVLITARDEQQQKEGLVKQASEQLDAARMVIANRMYKNLGVLMAKYYQNPIEIERFYDLELIRSHNTPDDTEVPTPATGTVGAGMHTNVLSNGFSATSIFTITNTGTVPLLFYLSATATNDIIPPSVGIAVAPGSTNTYSVLEFGATFMPFLNAKNDHAAIAGSYEVAVN